MSLLGEMVVESPTSSLVSFSSSASSYAGSRGVEADLPAIRFVLSDQYTQMGREERQRLLHEGTSTSTTLAAYVEIVFDSTLLPSFPLPIECRGADSLDTDGRFPTSTAEVRLRRTIGLKKDEYSLDKKSVTKAEVNNLLESAGFSKSNPYYIVPQGRVSLQSALAEWKPC